MSYIERVNGDIVAVFQSEQYSGQESLAENDAELLKFLEGLAPRRQFTSLEFLDLFAPAEQSAIASAAMSDVQAKLWYDRTLAAPFITLSDPRTASGLDALVAIGLITAGRRTEIIEAMQ